MSVGLSVPLKGAAATIEATPLAMARGAEPLIERVLRTINSVMVLAYWRVCREIVEFVQGDAKRAEYG